MVPIPARQSLASCWPIFICWLVLIVHKCRRHWNKSRILLSRNGTPIGLVVRVGILGAFAILGIGLVSRCPSEFIYLLFSLDRLAIINIFRRNKTLAICISLTVASREFLVRAYFNSNNVFNYPIFYSPCGGRNNFCQPKSEYYLNRTLISTFFFSKLYSFWYSFWPGHTTRIGVLAKTKCTSASYYFRYILYLKDHD